MAAPEPVNLPADPGPKGDLWFPYGLTRIVTPMGSIESRHPLVALLLGGAASFLIMYGFSFFTETAAFWWAAGITTCVMIICAFFLWRRVPQGPPENSPPKNKPKSVRTVRFGRAPADS